ncbi:uncharacterized protein LOC126369443 [Pectinophora gossypiella]|uniref:uncharacterized protein LOC126369443 n=1 Tax=Pectinophora gossypiella TaxID=13191 RepID=UPI00214F42F2|nr:uncharacterized protein LOC126369443 [Pectinophora gossypiella]
MVSRIILRTAFPSTFKITKTAAQSTKPKIVWNLSIHVPSVCSTKESIGRRHFSQQTTTEEMSLSVDFDYVNKAIKDDKVLIVDVREPDEIKEHGKIPNSVNIPLGTVTSVLSQMSEKEFEQVYQRPKPTEDTEMIFYCMIGKRSGMAQENAQKLGFRNVKNYLGSFTDWAAKTK